MKPSRQHPGSWSARVPIRSARRMLHIAMQTLRYGLEDVAGALADVAFDIRRGLRHWRRGAAARLRARRR